MFSVIVGFLLVLVVGGTVMCSLAMSTYKKQNQLLVDLGLIEKWTGENTNPFYKWGWRKTTGERVWAERIVREAFKKAKVWLTPDDLLFFENQCKQHESGQKVPLEKLKGHIDNIIHRTDALNSTIQKLVSKIIHDTLSVSISEAESILREQGINVEKEKVRHRFGTWQIRRVLSNVGEQILSANSKGFRMEDPNSQYIFHIHGFEGWRQFVSSYKSALESQLSRGGISHGNPVLHSIRSSVREGLLKDYEDDIRESQHFREVLEEEINRKEIQLSSDHIDELETTFYTWQFTKGVNFNLVDHKNARELLVGARVCPHFREMIIQQLNPDFRSLHEFINLFPRHVIFHGGDKSARAFASDQYLKHIEELLSVFASPTGKDPITPALLTVKTEEIEKQMEAAMDHSTLPAILQKKQHREFPPDGNYITQILMRKKKESMRDRFLSETDAEEKGWIINLAPMDNEYSNEFAELDDQPYRTYVRFPCDEYKGIDYTSHSFHAKQQRILFLNQILDTLTQMPPIGVSSSSKSNKSTFPSKNTPKNSTPATAPAGV